MPPPKGKRECKFFASGRCTRGDSCRFSHGDGSPATAATRDPPPDSDVIQPADDAAARCESTHGDADADAPLSEEVQDELDVLLEIYGDEVVIRDRTITMTLRPRTTHQLVRVTALIELPPRYVIMITVLSFYSVAELVVTLQCITYLDHVVHLYDSSSCVQFRRTLFFSREQSTTATTVDMINTPSSKRQIPGHGTYSDAVASPWALRAIDRCSSCLGWGDGCRARRNTRGFPDVGVHGRLRVGAQPAE